MTCNNIPVWSHQNIRAALADTPPHAASYHNKTINPQLVQMETWKSRKFKLAAKCRSVCFHLCNVLQPATQSDEDKEHGRSVEEGDGALAGPLSHGHHEDHAGVDVGDGGSQHDQDVHVGRAVFQRAVRLDVEVPASEDLEGTTERKYGLLRFFFFFFFCFFLLQPRGALTCTGVQSTKKARLRRERPGSRF